MDHLVILFRLLRAWRAFQRRDRQRILKRLRAALKRQGPVLTQAEWLDLGEGLGII